MIRRALCLLAVGATSAALAACGGSGEKPAQAAGSPERPLQAQATPVAKGAKRTNEAGTPQAAAGAAKPGYEKLLERQSRKPKKRFSPCNLVSKTQAGAIVGRTIVTVTEAPQGPTCIYRSKDDGAGFVTLALQTQPIAAMKRQMRQRRTVGVAGRKAYCGTAGQPMLYLPVSDGRVLSVSAPCAVAKRFATSALARLSS
jgi:hypothetical protein